MGLYDWDNLTAGELTELYTRKVAFGEEVVVVRAEMKAGESTRPHSHRNEEVIVVLKGAWRFLMSEGDVVLTDTQVLCIPAGVRHASEVLEDVVALHIFAPARDDWSAGVDQSLSNDPDQFLWAI